MTLKTQGLEAIALYRRRVSNKRRVSIKRRGFEVRVLIFIFIRGHLLEVLYGNYHHHHRLLRQNGSR